MNYYIQQFQNELFDIEVLVDNRTNKEWFGLKAVCNICGIVNHRDVKTRLNSKYILEIPYSELPIVGSTDGVVGHKNKAFVNESGIYEIILTSRNNDKIKPFREWVTEEVLPSIRKTGEYKVVSKEDPLVAQARYNLESSINYVKLRDEQERIKHKQEKHDTRITNIEVKTDSILGTSEYFTVVAYAKLNKIILTSLQAQSIGRMCSKVTKEMNIPKEFIPNRNYGEIGAYHKSVLEKVFFIDCGFDVKIYDDEL